MEEVPDAHCSKSRFLKDVLNEITTFASPDGAQGDPKSLRRPPARARNEFHTPLESRIDFWTFYIPSKTVLEAQVISFEDPPPNASDLGRGGET